MVKQRVPGTIRIDEPALVRINLLMSPLVRLSFIVRRTYIRQTYIRMTYINLRFDVSKVTAKVVALEK